MVKTIIPFLAIITFSCMLIAQPSIQWSKCMGGTAMEWPYKIQQTSDGGYIVSGDTESGDGDVTGHHGVRDFWIVKIDTSGNISWQKCLGGTGDEHSAAVQQTTDGGYIVAGATESNDGDVILNHGGWDYWVVKLNSNGSINWQKSFGGTEDDHANAVQQTSDGGYIISGYSESNDGNVTGNHGEMDFWVVKLNSAGVMTWQKSIGGLYRDTPFAIQETIDGGFIIAGSGFRVNIGYDYMLVKLNSTGGISWQQYYGDYALDEAKAISQTSDGGYIVAGTSYYCLDIHGTDFSDFWVLKLDSAGTIIWERAYGGYYWDYPYSILQTADGGYVIGGTGTANSGDITGNHGNEDYWVVNTDSLGNIIWQKCFGGVADDNLFSIDITSDGGYILAGSSESNDGDVTGNHGSRDLWVVKLSSAIGIQEIDNTLSDLSIFPNPISHSATLRFYLLQEEDISVSVHDVTGRLIENLFAGSLTTGNHQFSWNARGENKNEGGIYLLKIVSNTFSHSRKMVLLH